VAESSRLAASNCKTRRRFLVPVVQLPAVSGWNRYRGEYPHRVRAAHFKHGWVFITLNDWSLVRIRRGDWGKIANPIAQERRSPIVGEDIWDQLQPGTYKIVLLRGEDIDVFRSYFNLMNWIENAASEVIIDGE